MKKQKSSIIVLSCSESSGDESEKAKPKIDKEELRKYLQNSDEDDESAKKTVPKKSKKFVKKRKTSSHNVDQGKLSETIKKTKKSPQKVLLQKYLLQGDDFKILQTRQRNSAPLLLIILKEKTTNTWLNTITKRFTSVLPTLKTSLLTKILIVETSISQRPRKSQIKTVNLLTSYHLIQIIGLSIF